nr:energy transducer TonB [Saprospiraceae bacterium]
MNSEEKEKEDKKKGMWFSIGYAILLLLILFLPILSYTYPPPGQEGILVSFGMPEVGEGDDLPDTQQEEIVEPTPPAEAEPDESEVAETTPPAPDDNILTSDTEEEILIREQQEQQRQKEDAERIRQERLARERREAEEAEKKKAEEAQRKQEEYEETKKQFGDLLGGGRGQTGQSGNQGDLDGDPDATRLEGISTGSGMVGGGLGNRGVLFEPSIRDNSQKTGKVVVRVCVDSNGEVVSAEYTQRGSTTTDGYLRSKAIESAQRFKFSQSDVDRQCGTITIDFRLQ